MRWLATINDYHFLQVSSNKNETLFYLSLFI